MTVLAFTIPSDYHVIAVRWGLKKFGIEMATFYTSDLPDETKLTLDLFEENPTLVIDSRRICVDDISVFWNRRMERPTAPEWLHEDDHELIERSCFEFANNTRHLISRFVPTINSPNSQNHADRKAVQLLVAKSLGMNIKKTIFSNDFTDISKMKNDYDIIHKPFQVYHWRDKKTRAPLSLP